MWTIQLLLAIVFAAAGAIKLVRSKEQVEHNPAFSEAQVRLLGLAELVGAIGLVAPTATGIAPYLSRVAAAGLATLMGGAVATLAVQRKSPIFPTVVALVLIAVATGR